MLGVLLAFLFLLTIFLFHPRLAEALIFVPRFFLTLLVIFPQTEGHIANLLKVFTVVTNALTLDKAWMLTYNFCLFQCR